jgi:hypothetical protein
MAVSFFTRPPPRWLKRTELLLPPCPERLPRRWSNAPHRPAPERFFKASDRICLGALIFEVRAGDAEYPGSVWVAFLRVSRT